MSVKSCADEMDLWYTYNMAVCRYIRNGKAPSVRRMNKCLTIVIPDMSSARFRAETI